MSLLLIFSRHPGKKAGEKDARCVFLQRVKKGKNLCLERASRLLLQYTVLSRVANCQMGQTFASRLLPPPSTFFRRRVVVVGIPNFPIFATSTQSGLGICKTSLKVKRAHKLPTYKNDAPYKRLMVNIKIIRIFLFNFFCFKCWGVTGQSKLSLEKSSVCLLV